MLFETKFAEWIAFNKWDLMYEEDGVYYWSHETMADVSTELLFDMFLNELTNEQTQ